LRLGYINFGAQDGRFHTAKYTIAELTLLIGTMQFRPPDDGTQGDGDNIQQQGRGTMGVNAGQSGTFLDS
jgi:hypothetical protein